MPFALNTVVPWGRSFDEYERMFALSKSDMDGRILGCADGPAAFNAEATRSGATVISCDPIYQCSNREIRERIDAAYPKMIEQARQNCDEFVWSYFESPDDLGIARMNAMRVFLEDYDLGREQGRYVADELPPLRFEDQYFDLALCSHFLFLYSERLTQDFHVSAIREMARVAAEVRIFSLVALGGTPSKHLDAVRRRLQEAGFSITIERVAYEFVRCANEMMRVRHLGG